MASSATIRPSLKIAVVGANEPIPSVSKKFVTNPTTHSNGVGLRRPPGSDLALRCHCSQSRPPNQAPVANSVPTSRYLIALTCSVWVSHDCARQTTLGPSRLDRPILI